MTLHAINAYRLRVRACPAREAREHIRKIVMEGIRLREPRPWMLSFALRCAYFADPSSEVVVVLFRDKVRTVVTPVRGDKLVPVLASRLASAWGARLTTTPAP